MSASADGVSPSPARWSIALAFLVLFLSWGTTYLATGIGIREEHMPPALFGGLRLSLAGFLLLLYQLGRGQSLRLTRGEFARLLLVSWFLFLGANLLISFGQQQVPSSAAAILVATTPLWMGLFGMMWPRGERLSWRGWLGLLIGFAGIVLTMAPQVSAGFALHDYHLLLILASAACWALGSLVSRHLALPVPHLTSAGYQMLLGGLSQVFAGTLFGEWQEIPPITQRTIAAFLYLLVVGSLSGFVAFNWLLGHIPAAQVGTYAYVNPVIAVLVGWFFEEPIHFWLLGGVAVILCGVYLVRSDHAPSREIELEPD